jgi:hypothetical protein
MHQVVIIHSHKQEIIVFFVFIPSILFRLDSSNDILDIFIIIS